MTKIKLENISYVYGAGTPYCIRALDNINLDIEAGCVTGIIGHTGSGKSTLVQLLNGLERPGEGRVLLDGEDIWQNPKQITKIRFRVGFVMQYPEYQLFEESVSKDIAYGPKNMGLDDAEIARRVAEASQIVGLSPELLQKSPFDLSGGEKRRVAIAGVMAMTPEVLVLDEPAAGLDPVGRATIFDAVEKYRRQTGATILIVSHSMEDMARICDNIIVMSGGKVIMSGKTNEVFSRSEELAANGLDIPEISKLMLKLKSFGIYDREDVPYTVEDALGILTRELGGRKTDL